MTTSTTNLGTKVGRSRRRSSQLWQVPTFLIGLLAFLGVAASTPWRLTPQEKEFDRLVNALRAGLDNNEPADVLVGHAEAIQLRMQVTNRRSSEAHFLVGSAYYREALQKPAVEAWEIVAQHLEEALAHGGASEDKAALQYRLGYSLYQLNRDVPRALELVTLGVEKGAEQPLQGYQLLVDAYLKRTPPNVDGAHVGQRARPRSDAGPRYRSRGPGPVAARRTIDAQGIACRGDQGAGADRPQSAARRVGQRRGCCKRVAARTTDSGTRRYRSGRTCSPRLLRSREAGRESYMRWGGAIRILNLPITRKPFVSGRRP